MSASDRGWLALGLLAVLAVLPGCESDVAPVESPRAKDPTLRGLVAFLKDAELKVGERATPTAQADQKARIGAAVGLANELAGAGIRADLATETEWRAIEGLPVVLERFASAERAAAAAGVRTREEAARPDAGKVVYLVAGDMLLSVHGPGGGGAGPLPGTSSRSASPPDPETVGRLDAALRAFHAR